MDCCGSSYVPTTFLSCAFWHWIWQKESVFRNVTTGKKIFLNLTVPSKVAE